MIDSHAHLTSPEMLSDLDEIIQRAKKAGVEKIINICTDQPSLEEGLKLRKKYPQIYHTAATTPHDVEKEGESFFPMVQEVVKELVAIGETGLDYYYEHSPKRLQQHFLSRYLKLGLQANLPVIFHCREAFEDLFAITDEQYQGAPALVHCFTGTLKEARQCLDRGWIISFSGIVTFKKSEDLRQVVKFVPMDRLFIETDAPYLAPQSKRGKRNEPANIVEVFQLIADLKNVSMEEIKRETNRIISQFFALN